MKQLIVLACVLPILLLFLGQYSLDQKNSVALSVFQEQVYTAKEKAKQEGCFTPEIKEELRRNLSEKLGVSGEDIVIVATESRQYRVNSFDAGSARGLIHYKISIPVEKLMAGEKLLGISAKDNAGMYTVEGTTASERLPN